MCEIEEKFNIQRIKDTLEIAEKLASVNLLSTSSSSSTRIRRKLQLKYNEDGNFVPPKQVLLYLVR